MSCMELDGRVAIVTGGGRGIGRSTSRLLRARGRPARHERPRRRHPTDRATTTGPARAVADELTASAAPRSPTTPTSLIIGRRAAGQAAIDFVRPTRHRSSTLPASSATG